MNRMSMVPPSVGGPWYTPVALITCIAVSFLMGSVMAGWSTAEAHEPSECPAPPPCECEVISATCRDSVPAECLVVAPVLMSDEQLQSVEAALRAIESADSIRQGPPAPE